MNLTIQQINFYKSHQINTINPKEKVKQAYSSNDNLLLNFETSQVLKNQILFTSGNLQRKRLKKISEKYNLDIKPEELSYIFSPESVNNRRKIKVAKKGSRIFSLHLRYALYKKFPNKSEGELTYIVSEYSEIQNKARILKTLIPEDLLEKDPTGKSDDKLYSQYFDLLLTTIMKKDNGYKNVQDFLKNFVTPILISDEQTARKNEFEILAETIEEYGGNYDKTYIQTKIIKNGCRYKIFYGNKLLSEETANDPHDRTARLKCVQKAISAIQNGILEQEEPSEERLYQDFRFPDEKRLAKLNKFQKKYGLNFNNINLLNQVFLYGTMPDGSVIPHPNSYQVLEFIGDGVLDFCIHEILEEILPEKRKNWLIEKIKENFTNNSNLAILAKEMGLMNFAINIDSKISEKRHADMLEALIGAIYLDNGEDGLNKAYEFLYNNFKNTLLKM